MELRPGTLVAFTPRREPWALGYRRGVVVKADESAAAFLRGVAGRLPSALGSLCERDLGRLAAEGDRRGVVVRLAPCPRLPAGLDVMVPPEWVVPAGDAGDN